jgi:hypothetical protein
LCNEHLPAHELPADHCAKSLQPLFRTERSEQREVLRYVPPRKCRTRSIHWRHPVRLHGPMLALGGLHREQYEGRCQPAAAMPFYGSAATRIAKHRWLPSERHLLIPGFVFTGLTSKGRTEKPTGAWTPEQTVEFMIERVAARGSATPNTGDKSTFPGIGLTCHFIAGATKPRASRPSDVCKVRR